MLKLKLAIFISLTVVTATHATEAMRILREREDELDLILTEILLPDMDKYELLETMGEISSIPIVSKYPALFTLCCHCVLCPKILYTLNSL